MLRPPNTHSASKPTFPYHDRRVSKGPAQFSPSPAGLGQPSAPQDLNRFQPTAELQTPLPPGRGQLSYFKPSALPPPPLGSHKRFLLAYGVGSFMKGLVDATLGFSREKIESGILGLVVLFEQLTSSTLFQEKVLTVPGGLA